MRPIIGIRARLPMGTNRERIEHLELRLGIVQEGLQQMEEALHRISSVLITNQENPNHSNPTEKATVDVGRSSCPNQPS